MSTGAPATSPVRTDTARFAIVACVAAVALATAYRVNISPPIAQAAAIGLLCMGCWATGAIPEIATTLLFFALATLLALASPAVVFSGFASSAFWLVLSGMIVGLAISKTGLAQRIAAALARSLSGSYARLIGGIVMLSFGLAFVMPSNMGRISLLVPIILALADHVGLAPGRPGRTGLVLAVGFATFMLSTSILPANVPNLVMAGAAETIYGVHFSYLPYLLLHAPVLGIVKGMLIVAAILILFPDKLDPVPSAASDPVRPPLSEKELRLSVIIVATLALWMTDTIHHIQPAWIGLAAATVCLMPGIGIIDAASFTSINFRTVFYVAGLLGLVATVDQTGLGRELGRFLLSVVPFSEGATFGNYLGLVGLTSALSIVATANGEPALFTPMAREISASTGFDLPTVIMVQVIGFSTVLLPYQAPPIVVAAELGGVSARATAKLALVVAGLSFVLAVPLNFLWWKLLGQF
ncbi:SLC13 family permease [Bradyrhizobium sp. BR 10289]|uniref:SLC13 family permease n=1 Tax=Bradyrhizobium sp. BR 10289 TaxID=2749993 RepID=UPI001C64526B|nr:SLC13 family permease [Bradyrhizobium sp. BR 10289]MBW7970550.1 anion permease [Bradyrhizobium sp. BR 10289]